MIEVLRKQLVDTKKAMDIIITILVVIGACLVPTFLAKIIPLGKYQQIIVGTIVNASLIAVALYTKGGIKTLAMTTLPSVSTILGGALFSNMTLYSRLMIPAIWLGNFAFIYLFKALYVNKKLNYIITAALAIIVKAGIIYSGFLIMSSLVAIPEMAKNTLSTSMGVTQLITATLGSVVILTSVIGLKKVNNK